MKPTPFHLFLILAVAAAGAGWLRQNNATVRAEALSQVRADSLAQARESLDVATSRHMTDLERWAADTVRLRSLYSSSRRRMDSLATAYASKAPQVDTILLTLPPEASEPIREALSTLTAEVQSCRLTVASLDSLASGCSVRLARADTLLSQERALRFATESALTIERKRASPGLFTRISRGLPWLGFGVLVGYLRR